MEDKFFSVIFLLALTPLLVDALIPQIQIITIGSVGISIFRQLYLIAVASAMYIILSRRHIIIYADLLKSLMLLSIYVAFIFVYSLMLGGLSFDYILTGIMNNFSFIFLLMLICLTPSFLSERRLLKYLISIAIVTSCLGITQYFMNIPILATESDEYKIQAWLYITPQGTHVRGFSLFNNALGFGFFLIFVLGIAIYRSRLSWGSRLLVLLLALACFCTVTRNIYLGSILAVLGAIFYIKQIKLRGLVLTILPIVAFLVGLLVANLGGGETSITDGSTLDMRTQFWRDEISRQIVASESELLFGRGLYQGGSEFSDFVVDNTYLQLVSHVGLFGLIFYIFFYFSLLRYVINQEGSSLRCGLYVFMVAWPAMAIFNIVTVQLPLFALLVAAVGSNKVTQPRLLSQSYDGQIISE